MQLDLSTVNLQTDAFARTLRQRHAVFGGQLQKSSFNGSLFRLPLRSAASPLSEQVRTMLQSLQKLLHSAHSMPTCFARFLV